MTGADQIAGCVGVGVGVRVAVGVGVGVGVGVAVGVGVGVGVAITVALESYSSTLLSAEQCPSELHINAPVTRTLPLPIGAIAYASRGWLVLAV